jgi:pyruvate,orthophosphate dikinase
MEKATDICYLDYLVGTLATAYRGLITSLVARDFCITVRGDATEFKGTIISIPEGQYIICLMEGGMELARDELRAGFFRLITDSSVIETAGNLQLDVIQNGRHIGTFLLKKETRGGVFASAIEVSQDLRGIRSMALVDAVKEWDGIKKTAEMLVSHILSTKKDWRSLSEDINSFSKDLFWTVRDAFYLWHEVLIRFSLRAYENGDKGFRTRALSNILSLIELPLEQETDTAKLAHVAAAWIQEVSDARIDLSPQAGHTLRILGQISGRLPELDLNPLLKAFLSSLKDKAASVHALKSRFFDVLGEGLSGEALSPLTKYSKEARNVFIHTIDEIEKKLENGTESSLLLNDIRPLDIQLLDRENMLTEIFDTLTANISLISDRNIAYALSALPDINDLGADARRIVIMNITALLKILLAEKRGNACRLMLETTGVSSVNDDVLLNAGTAKSILASSDEELIAFYKERLKSITVPPPKVSGLSRDTWAEIVNPAHLKRLSAFLGVMAADDVRFKDILVHVISNLFITGVWIPDDRLFQRDISSYLNSGVLKNNFLLHYLLLKKFPSYFSEVGASGRIRDLTTDIDSWGNDTVLYFLRKQVHVNASSNNIRLIEQIISAWVWHDLAFLNEWVPEDIISGMKKDRLEEYSQAMRHLFKPLDIIDGDTIQFEKLLECADSDLDRTAGSIDTTEEVRKKITLLCRIYREIRMKYDLQGERTERPADLKTGFAEALEKLRQLKAVYTSQEKTVPSESFYFKRHIAFGIPSVIGSYHEPKFDALAETFRIEEQVRLLLEDLILQVEKNGEAIDAGMLRAWIECLGYIHELFILHELDNFQAGEALVVLKTNGLYLSQVSDVLKIWQRELTWMVELCYRTFRKPLNDLLIRHPRQDLPGFLQRIGTDDEGFIDKVVDVTIRDIISSVTGFEELDRLLNSLIKKVSSLAESGRDLKMPDPEVIERKKWYLLSDLSSANASSLAPLLGGKAKNLIYLRDRGIRVPYGAVLPSDITGEYEKYVSGPEFKNTLREAVGAIERSTGLSFGGGAAPLFLSVRSGSYISMPGILSTILYCGMNRKSIEGFIDATGDPLAACDSYRRFIRHYAEVVLEAETSIFDRIQTEVLERKEVKELQDLDAGGMQEIVDLCLGRLEENGLRIPDDPYEQLERSVQAIFRSWFSAKADQFRKAMAVSEHWGTSVTLMNMIYGNRRGSGASVFFTRIPVSFERGIYGEIREAGTGDDLVYGHFTNRPLSRRQTLRDDSLEDRDPDLYRAYNEIALRVEDAMGGLPQEVESAYVMEGDRRLIYILQTKRMEFGTGSAERFDDSCRMESSVIGRGIGVHGGALSGIVTFTASPEHIRTLKEDSQQPVILLRKETSTDDVSVMSVIDGIITSAGGATSHAAILSQKFDVTAVVGCTDMKISDAKYMPHAIIGNYEVREGSSISIDGSTGLVYSGICLLRVRDRRY